ncbi:MAG TPA: phosphotransferase [Propionibacteriaceae bacterium]|nr:phosphotransferase [Propionibacteriaceae bacterium]
MADVKPLRHGYTNSTLTDGRVVTKTYLGPDAEGRQATEELALRRLAGLLPVPALVSSTPGTCTTAWVAGQPGQEAIEVGRAADVLHACGVLLNQLQQVDPSLLFERAEGTLVHNDFGPNNVLMRPDLSGVQLLCDWEWVAVGDRYTDLAWAEWIVREHHPYATDALPALFEGYMDRPPWRVRQAAMARRAGQHREFVRRWHGSAAIWDNRIAAILAWPELGN